MSFLGQYGYKVLKFSKEPRYHGPKKRARETFLRYPPRQILSAEEAVKYIWRRHPRLARQVHRITPYADVPVGDGRINILVVWVGFFAQARDILYEDAGTIVRETGWYPMVTGEFSFAYRSSVENLLRKLEGRDKLLRHVALGRWISLATLARGESGSSFLVRTSESNVMLDFGKEFHNDLTDRVEIFVLSHIHHDHSGGFLSAFNALAPKIVLMSEETLRFLSFRLGEAFARVASRTYCPPFGDRIPVEGGFFVFSDANHMAGAMMTQIVFEDNRSLLYTGDCSFENVFGSAEPRHRGPPFAEGNNGSSGLTVALVDSTLIGRNTDENAHRAFDEWLFIQALRSLRKALLLVERIDYGARLYLLLYDLMMQGPNRIRDVYVYLDSEIYLFLRWLLIGYVGKRRDKLDPRLSKLLVARKNPFENVMLFKNNYGEMTRRNLAYHLERERGLIFINTMHSLQQLGDLWAKVPLRAEKGDRAFTFGRVAENKGILKTLESPVFRDLDIVSHSGFEWSLHTSEEVMKRVLELCRWAENIYLFHNWPDRLESFAHTIKNNSIKVSAVPDIVADFQR